MFVTFGAFKGLVVVTFLCRKSSINEDFADLSSFVVVLSPLVVSLLKSARLLVILFVVVVVAERRDEARNDEEDVLC
jgi:hypothetical protein